MGGAPRSNAGRLAASALARVDQTPRTHYLALLDDAFVATPPHYATQVFGDLFRKCGQDPSWLASLLASDSYMEGYSGRRLWQYAGLLQDQELAQRMQKHAMDEVRHSKIFARALIKTFPVLASDVLRNDLARNAPDLETVPIRTLDDPVPDAEEVLTSLILINLFEIKALVLGMLIKPLVIAHSPERNRALLGKMLDTIIADEARHISYSAEFIESACLNGQRDRVRHAFRDFQSTLNQVAATDLDADFHSNAQVLAG
jgi:hypothetical protein